MTISDLRAVALNSTKAEQGIPAVRRQVYARASSEFQDNVPGDRRQNRSGNLGNRRTDNWMPYSAVFVTQLLAQQFDEQMRARNDENIYS